MAAARTSCRNSTSRSSRRTSLRSNPFGANSCLRSSLTGLAGFAFDVALDQQPSEEPPQRHEAAIHAGDRLTLAPGAGGPESRPRPERVTLFTVKTSRFASTNQRANFRRSFRIARRVLAEKSWSWRNRRARRSSSSPTRRPVENIIAPILTVLLTEIRHHVDTNSSKLGR